MSKYYIRVNGVGNAWPVPLGTRHPFYDAGDIEQLANVSFSILKLSADPASGVIEPATNSLLAKGPKKTAFRCPLGTRLPLYH